MQVVTLGAGYVELVSGACLADIDADYTFTDVDEQKAIRTTLKIPSSKKE